MDIIRSFEDSRIRLVQNPVNLRLAGTLNRGLDLISSQYIIRMDADDISKPGRFEGLIAFMDDHPNVDICSSWLEIFDDTSVDLMQFPESDEEIKCHMLFNSPIAHAASIWRVDSLRKHQLKFNDSIALGQDYDFWQRAAQFLRFYNIQETLYQYRYINSDKHYAKQQNTAIKVRERQLQLLRVEATDQDISLHHAIARNEYERSTKVFNQIDRWFSRLSKANHTSNVYPVSTFDDMLVEKWYMIRDAICDRKRQKDIALVKSSLFNVRYKASYFKRLFS